MIDKDFTSYSFRKYYIPQRMIAPIKRYVLEHQAPGDFLMAVLRNNLREAIERADDENIDHLPAYMALLYNEAPSQCWGSKEKVNNWLNAIKGETGK